MIKKKMSLKWKWTIQLSLVFVGLYLILSYSMLHFIKQQNIIYERELSQNYINSLVEVISDTNETNIQKILEKQSLSEKNNLTTPYDYRLRKDGIIIQIFNNNHQLIFENKPIPVAENLFKESSQLYPIQYNDKERLIAKHVLKNNTNNIIGYISFYFDLDGLNQRNQEIDKTYLLISSIAIVFLISISALLSYLFFRPIQHMNEVMKSLKEDALSKKRMHISHEKQDELTDLSVGFNDLLDTMELYINQQKQFVEDVSHELKTPVAIVEGHLKMLNRWGKTDPTLLEESLNASLLEIGRMKVLVQEMLDLSRAEQVGINYNKELSEITSVVEQVYQNFQLIYPNFKFRLDKDNLGSQEIYSYISRYHMEQVLIILLDNAVKYSTDLPHVHVSISKTVNKVQISIQDFGEGIATEDLSKVFGRFYRVDKARTRNKGGNGLGLSIAKELIEGYRGKITVESVINSGTTFRIILPFVTDNDLIEKEIKNV